MNSISPWYRTCVGAGKRAIQREARRRIHSTFEASATVPVVSEEMTPNDSTASLETISRYFHVQQPLLLRQIISDEAAIQRWKTWEHFEKSVNPDTVVHVEIGGSYNAEGERSDIRFADYLLYLRFFEEEFGQTGDVSPPVEKLVYLAQNDVPAELYEDFDVPSFCSVVGEGKLYSTMIWMGPYGCVSPLHFDPLDNCLMQFVGSKRVLLYPPDVYIYAGEHGNQANTSPVNPESPLDLGKYPLLTHLPPALDCVIYPGDVLYIPKKWWHHVRTLETSISVNAWWR